MYPHTDIRLLSWKKTLCIFYSQDSGGLAGQILARTGDWSISSSSAMAEFSQLDPPVSAEVSGCHTGNIMKKCLALTIFQGQQEGQEDQEDVPPIAYKLPSWDVTGFGESWLSHF